LLPLQQALIPTVRIAPAKVWPQGVAPQPAPGARVFGNSSEIKMTSEKTVSTAIFFNSRCTRSRF